MLLAEMQSRIVGAKNYTAEDMRSDAEAMFYKS